ncbi:MAG: GDSL-type esterase/lipase family protein [Nitrospira sp.]|nr:GDSL-type esterase/lipase family protein [Nitrospira sp.]
MRTRFAAWPMWKRAVALAIPAVVVLTLGEVAGRLLEQYAGYMPRRAVGYIVGNPFLRTALPPGLQFQSGPFRVEVNSLGFRGPEIAMPKPKGVFRIFALGESTTFGWKGVRSHDEAWPALLEAKLRAAYPDRTFEVVNAGVPGYTSIEQRINFMLRVSHLEPDAILIYHGNNDLNWSWVPDLQTKLIYARGESISAPGWYNRMVDHSYVLMEIRSRINLVSRSSKVKRDDVDAAALKMLEQNLQGLIAEARRAKVQVAIGTFSHGLDEAGKPEQYNADETALGVPAVGRWFDNLSPQGLRRSFPLYNDMVRSLARAEGLPLAEPAKQVPPTPEFHTDWCHFTAKGEQLMAQIWFDALEQAGWFKPVGMVEEKPFNRADR